MTGMQQMSLCMGPLRTSRFTYAATPVKSGQESWINMIVWKYVLTIEPANMLKEEMMTTDESLKSNLEEIFVECTRFRFFSKPGGFGGLNIHDLVFKSEPHRSGTTDEACMCWCGAKLTFQPTTLDISVRCAMIIFVLTFSYLSTDV